MLFLSSTQTIQIVLFWMRTWAMRKDKWMSNRKKTYVNVCSGDIENILSWWYELKLATVGRHTAKLGLSEHPNNRRTDNRSLEVIFCLLFSTFKPRWIFRALLTGCQMLRLDLYPVIYSIREDAVTKDKKYLYNITVLAPEFHLALHVVWLDRSVHVYSIGLKPAATLLHLHHFRNHTVHV